MKIARRGKVLANYRGADDLVSARFQAAVGLPWKDELGESEHDYRIDDSGQDRQDEGHFDGGYEFSHDFSSSDHVKCGEGNVDQFDSDERNQDSAESIDDEVARENRRRAHRAIFHAA